MRALAAELDQRLAAGTRRVVLDNTYLTRAQRHDVLEIAGRHGVPVRCVWLDTPLAQAQANLVERLLDRRGSLPAPLELRELARREPGLLAPTSQMRALRELEPPEADEGFAAVEHVPFVRGPSTGGAAVFAAARALVRPAGKALEDADRVEPCLVFDWNPDGDETVLAAAAARLSAVVEGTVETGAVPASGGTAELLVPAAAAGLPLAFARAHGVDPARSLLVGSGPAHRTLATTLGARFIPVEAEVG